MKKMLMALAIPGLLIGCSKDDKPANPSKNSFFGMFLGQTAHQITVLNADDQPVANAEILIGDALNAPFSGNFITTDANGNADVPAEWTSAEALTIDAKGYVRATYLAQEPGAVTIKLRKSVNKTQYEVKGPTTGLPIQDKDGWVDFGLVMPAFSKSDILSFNLDNVISAQNDQIEAMGQKIDVPANISLPAQREKYALFTITLDKPNYRIYFGQNGVNRVFAAKGRFPFKSTVDALRNGADFFDLINDFKLTGGAIRDVDVKSASTNLTMPTGELSFKDPKYVQAPQVRGDEAFMALGVANQQGFLIPTDVKRVEPGQKMAINTLPGAENFALGIVQRPKEKGDRMSATLIPFTGTVAPKMLPLVADPVIQGDELLLPKFNSVEGVNPIATYTLLTKEEEVKQGSATVKIQTPQWEIYATTWVERVKLPDFPTALAIPGTKRWNVNFIGSQTASQVPAGPAIIDAATHVTHSSISF
ncbi:hypothetical protein ACES2L_10905 [Bdellovibrio bacteriovorus]